MTTVIRPELADASGVEVTDYLLPLGWTEIATAHVNEPPAMVVEAIGAGDLDADLDAFVPTAPADEYVHVPPDLKPHRNHLRLYLEAERDGSLATWTATEFRQRTAHALADVIAWMRKNLPDDA